MSQHGILHGDLVGLDGILNVLMASDILKTPFDIHAGGLDLKFPHHDNEIAQSCCFKNKNDDIQSYAKYWMRNGFVTLEKKMSKSLGNIKLLKDT